MLVGVGMKKSHIIFAAVPIVCALGGFGAGQLLKDDGAHAAPAVQQHAAPATQAEAVLQTLSEQADHAPAHDDGHAAQPEVTITTPHKEVLTPAALHSEPAHEPVPLDGDKHRIDYGKLAEKEKEAAREAKIAKARAAQEQEVAALKDKTPMSRATHPSLMPVETEAKIAEGAIKKIAETEEHVVKLGRMTVPVYGAKSISYFVADFGVSVTDLDQASHYYTAENAARLRDQVMTTMHQIAETQLMRGPEVDSTILAERVSEDLRANFFGVADFIFLSLYKTDVPRG